MFRLATGMYEDHSNYCSDAYPDEAETHAAMITELGRERWGLARESERAGESVSPQRSWEGMLRSPSITIAGTPTLFSALTPGLVARDATVEFDLDGDGVYETPSSSGIAWVRFPDAEAHTVGVRVHDPETNTTAEATRTVMPAPRDSGAISYTPDGRRIDAPE